MQFQTKTGAATGLRTTCAIVPVYSGGELPAVTRSLDKAGGGLITRAIRNQDIKGETGELLLLTETGKLPCQRLLLVGLGARSRLDRRAWRPRHSKSWSASCVRRWSCEGASGA